MYAGAIMSDPTTALVELVANCWDAYATRVDIQWPDRTTSTPFKIEDNGIGMTPEEFEFRWRTIYYDRSVRQGLVVSPPPELRNASPRHVYGRNGKGRTAGFHFSSPYQVRTWKAGHEATFLVSQGIKDPIDPKLESERDGVEGHGTEITQHGIQFLFSSGSGGSFRSLSTRFLTNPAFTVSKLMECRLRFQRSFRTTLWPDGCQRTGPRQGSYHGHRQSPH